MNNIDVAIIFAYFALMIAIGIYASRKQSTIDDFFLGGGKIGTLSQACLWIAGWIGGASIIGGAAKAYEVGISASWYVGSIGIGCVLFGVFFAARIKRLRVEKNLLTYPELIETRYDGRTRIVATITTVSAYIAFAAAQLVAAAGLLQALLGWDFGISLLVAAAVIIIYTATGGFLAITYTDWVQITILFVGIVVVGIPIAIMHGGTVEALTTRLPASFFDPGAWGWGKILAYLVSIVLSIFVGMDNYMRCFAAKSERAARNGALLAAVFLIPFAVGATWLGMTAALLYPGAEDSGNILSVFIMQEFPVGLKGLLLVGLLAALMSTADICILIASANVTSDIYRRFINPQVSDPTMFRMSIVAAAVIGAIATFMAWRMQDVLDIILVAFIVNSAALFLPTYALMNFKQVSKTAAFWSMSLAFATVIGWYAAAALALHPVFELDPLWPGLAVSFVVFFGLTALTEKEAEVAT